MKPEAVIFDMDGVLVDSEPFGYEALRRVMARHGLPYGEAENAEFLGRTTLDSCRILRERHGLSESAETLADWYVEGMLEQIARGPIPMVGVPDVLQKIRAAGYRMALASSAEVRVIDANLTGPFLLCRAAIPHLKQRGGGSIINVSSLAGKNPFAGGACYSATKAGLDAFSHALMEEVRQHGIRVSVVAPGSVATGFSGHAPTAADAWKLAPEDVAETIFHLVTHPSRSLPSRVDLRPAQPPRKG